ncbi:MAG: hypothetical protein MJ082_02250, partial [Clostridia bacterium]|nr:hypothetical protein [Clostridia bacterium]
KGANDADNLTVTPTITAYKLTADTELDGDKTYYTKSDAGFNAVGSPDVANIGTYYEQDQGTISAVKVLVVTDDSAMVTLTSANNGNSVDIKGSNTAITDSTVRNVDVYIYYDGSDSSVNTNGIGNLGDATVELAFEVQARPHA